MNIAVTGLNATDNPGPGIPIIRSIKDSPRFKGKITGLIYDTLEPGIYMDGVVSKCYLIPYPSSGLQELFDRIALINSKEKIDIIIPSLDSELYGFLKIQDRLREIGIKTFLPSLEQLNIRGKDKLFYFCEDNNIKVPKNILVNSVQDLYNIPKEFEFPVAVKGIFYEAYIANNQEDVLTAYNKLRLKWGFPIIIQEFIQGDEFNVAALGDGTGNMVGAVAMRKLYITDKGKGWAGITIDDPNLLTISRKVISQTKWRSGMELEFIKSASTDEYFLLEINPRFPAWVYLTVAAGQNLPYALVDIICSGRTEQFDKYEIGKIFVRSSWDLITDIKSFEKIATLGEI